MRHHQEHNGLDEFNLFIRYSFVQNWVDKTLFKRHSIFVEQTAVFYGESVIRHCVTIILTTLHYISKICSQSWYHVSGGQVPKNNIR